LRGRGRARARRPAGLGLAGLQPDGRRRRRLHRRERNGDRRPPGDHLMRVLAVGDPLFSRGLDLGVVLIVVLKTLVTFGFLMVAVLFMVWFERKVIAHMQN